MGYGDALFTCDEVEAAVGQFEECLTLPTVMEDEESLRGRLHLRSFFGYLGLGEDTIHAVHALELPVVKCSHPVFYRRLVSLSGKAVEARGAFTELPMQFGVLEPALLQLEKQV